MKIFAQAIDLIDEAASRVRIMSSSTPLSIKEAAKVLETVQKEKDEAIAGQQYEFAAELREREQKLEEKMGSLEEQMEQRQEEEEVFLAVPMMRSQH